MVRGEDATMLAVVKVSGSSSSELKAHMYYDWVIGLVALVDNRANRLSIVYLWWHSLHFGPLSLSGHQCGIG